MNKFEKLFFWKKQTDNFDLSLLKKILFLLALVLVAGTISFFLGKNIEKRLSEKSISNLQAECSDQLTQKDEEMQFWVQDRGQQLATSVEPYDFSTFGIYSPLLEGNEVNVTKYKYRGAETIAKSVNTGNTTMRTFYIEKTGPLNEAFRHPLIGDAADLLTDIPTFRGYENYALNPNKVSKISKGWTEKDSYTNKNGIQMFYFENPAPKYIWSVSLQFYSTYSPMGKAMFVDIIQQVESPFGKDAKASIQAAKEQLKEIADTVDVKL